MDNICDQDCNNCPLINHKNSAMLTKTLNEIIKAFGQEAFNIIQSNCPNFTVCFACRIDDFCHVEGCLLDPDNYIKVKP